jgi:hypothetical protein
MPMNSHSNWDAYPGKDEPKPEQPTPQQTDLERARKVAARHYYGHDGNLGCCSAACKNCLGRSTDYVCQLCKLQADIAAEFQRVREEGLKSHAPKHTDDVYVDGFAQAMKMKLADKRAEGCSGWDKPAECTPEHLAGLFVKHIQKGDPIDLGNFAMMLHFRIGGSEALKAEWARVREEMKEQCAKAPDWLDKARQYMQVIMTHAGNANDEVAENYTKKLSDHLDEVAKWYRWQSESLAAFRAKFGVPSNCQALDKIEELQAALRSQGQKKCEINHEMNLWPHNPNTGRHCLKCTQEARRASEQEKTKA